MSVIYPPRATNSRHVTRNRQPRNNYGRTKHGLDNGQRFEVRYKDGLNQTAIWGWTDDRDEAAKWCRAVEKHPVFHTPRVRDRGGDAVDR